MAAPAKLLLSSFGLMPEKHDTCIQLISELWFCHPQMTETELSVQKRQHKLWPSHWQVLFNKPRVSLRLIHLTEPAMLFNFLIIQSVSKCLSKHINWWRFTVCHNLNPGSSQWGCTINLDYNYNKYALTSLSRLSIKDVISCTSSKRFNRNSWRSLCRWLSRPS